MSNPIRPMTDTTTAAASRSNAALEAAIVLTPSVRSLAPPPPAYDTAPALVPTPAPSDAPVASAPDAARSLGGMRRIGFTLERALQDIFEAFKELRLSRRDDEVNLGMMAEKQGDAAAEADRDAGRLALAGGVMGAAIGITSSAVIIGGGARNARANTQNFSNAMMGYQATSQGMQSIGQMAQGGVGMAQKFDEATKDESLAVQERLRAMGAANQQDEGAFQTHESNLMQTLGKIDDAEYQAQTTTSRDMV